MNAVSLSKIAEINPPGPKLAQLEPAEELDFERAAKLRDRLKELKDMPQIERNIPSAGSNSKTPKKTGRKP